MNHDPSPVRSAAAAQPKVEEPSHSVPRKYGALAGLAAGALAVCLGMFFAAITDVVSPIDAVGSEVIDRAPRSVKEFAIRTFGTDDKLALRVGIITLLAIAALGLGAAAIRRWWIGTAGIAAFGVIGAASAAHRPGETASAAVPSLLGAAVGAVVLFRMLRQSANSTTHDPSPTGGWDRRRFLIAGGSTVATAAFTGAIAVDRESRRINEIKDDAAAGLPATELDIVEIPPDAELFDETPFITPNDDFYRIDTALGFPRINVDDWSFQIDGLVDRPIAVSHSDLLEMPQVERVITLCCVSNEVGGDLIGNAVWRGVLLRDLLETAGVQPTAEQVFSTSLDGWTCGFPLSAAFDGRDAMVAVGMNGDALPLAHGYPARLVVPGLYGYVSATKWLARIELTTWDKQGYWVPRGWSREGPIKTQSRIDVVRAVTGASNTTATSSQVIAGVAWAQHRGIDYVELSIDDGPWERAELGADVSSDAWRQWLYEWDAQPGDHIVRVRATDTTGYTQTEETAPPAPNGATGYHTIRVKIKQ